MVAECAEILIDSDNPNRYISRKKAIELIASLARSFPSSGTVCVFAANDVRLTYQSGQAAKLTDDSADPLPCGHSSDPGIGWLLDWRKPGQHML